MPLNWNEIRQRAITFSRDWADASSERAEAQTFWNEFFHVFGKHRRTVATFEESVHSVTGSTHRIDVFWPTKLIGEHKSRGQDLSKAHTQAVGYITDLINEGREADTPRYIITTDFARIAVHDLEPTEGSDLFDFGADATIEFPLSDLHHHIRRFAFIAGYETQTLDPEDPANIRAAELLANVHDRLEEDGYTGHDLQRFMVRVLFCLFAEDTGIFEPDAFRNFIVNHTRPDGSDLGPQLAHFFHILNNPRDKRQANLNPDLAELPYVNGRLFEEQLNFASFNAPMREALLTACGFRWETISPAVFGSLFQSIMEPKERRQIGAHYTSERDILKLIRSLFLDKLTDQLNRCAAPRDYNRFLDHLRGLRFFDPACGCGNFLVIAFRELRRLEMDALNKLSEREHAGGGSLGLGQSQIPVSHFYGIEIEEWPALIAEVAMWLMDHQLNNEQFARFGTATPTVPLKESPRIVNANALQIDWNSVLPADQCSYIMGNPPFIGKHYRKKSQNDDLRSLLPSFKNFGDLDYVTGWYIKAAQYLDNTAGEAAFVSTNSICQGEQAAVLWQMLFKHFPSLSINFAHRSFSWESEARGKAHVHVVIVGISHQERKSKYIVEYAKDNDVPFVSACESISPYLISGPQHLVVSKRQKPLSDIPEMRCGNKPSDGGNLILTDAERDDLLAHEPEASKYLKRFTGAQEFINGNMRWCLWLVHADPADLRKMPHVLSRIEKVRDMRLKSTAQPTVKAAKRPAEFFYISQPSCRYTLIPEVSSERREYIPIGFADADLISANTNFLIASDELYYFGVMTSAMHMSWMRVVGGRLESRYRYSRTLIYNTFPWPDPEKMTAKQKQAVESAAQAVLDARKNHQHSGGGATLADLYDPLTMPADLAKAHAALDRAVDRCYRKQPFPDERRRFEHLFTLYEQLTAPLTATNKKSHRRVGKNNLLH